MAAQGLPVGKVEIEFTAGVWTDVTTDVQLKPGIQIKPGRADEFGQVQPTILTLTLENIPDSTAAKVQKYTPDNPLSTYYPNIVEGKRIRWTVTTPTTATPASTAHVRHLGTITSWQPNFAGELNTATVSVSAVDESGSYSTMLSDYAQQVIADNPTLGADLYLFTETGTPTSVLNSGNANGPAATIVTPAGTSFVLGTDSALMLEGTFGVTAAAHTAPYLTVQTPVATAQIEFWVKTSAETDLTFGALFLLWQPAGGIGWLAQPDVSGVYFAQFISNGGVDITSTVPLNDGLWHHLQVRFYGVNLIDAYQDGALIGGSIGTLPAGTWSFGGKPGSPTRSLPNTTYAGLAIQADSNASHYVYGLPNQTVGCQERYAELLSYAGTSGTASGSDDRLVIRKNTAGVNTNAALQELATTVGGFIWVDPTGAPKFITPDDARSTTVAATITIESDDDATNGLGWKRAVDSIPAGVSVSSPLGDVFVGSRSGRQTSLDTCADTPSHAADAGNASLTSSSKLRVASLTVDLSTAQTDLYASLLALKVGDRLRVTSLPSGAFGYTYKDVYVQGWTETLTDSAYTLTFDCTPADDPPFAIFDDATYGRFASAGATVTGGTCVGTTTTGTVIITTSSGPTWTTVGARYPMDLDWNGERITVSAPGGSSSPQTFTVTARGVAPTVARSHSAGEIVNVAYAARFAF